MNTASPSDRRRYLGNHRHRVRRATAFRNLPLLYKGSDFAHTDVISALAAHP
jgi:hypothetical protein